MNLSHDATSTSSLRAGMLGALFLAITLAGYAVYELILRPRAGFPSDDMAVILGGIDTLRVGHWLKFGYATGVALLTVGLRGLLHDQSPISMDLAVLAGTGSSVPCWPLSTPAGWPGSSGRQSVPNQFSPKVNPHVIRCSSLQPIRS